MEKVCVRCAKRMDLKMFPLRKKILSIGPTDKTQNVCKKCMYGIDWKYSTEKERKDRTKLLFDRYVIKRNGCWNWSGYINTSGYGILDVNRKKHNAHRVSWMIHRGKIPKGKCVLHRCDNRVCTNPDHLFIGSYKDNMQDMINKGRHNFLRGEDCPWSKYKESNIKIIVKDLESGLTSREVAEKNKVPKHLVKDVRHGKKWKHLDCVRNNKIKKIKPNAKILTEEKVKQIKRKFKKGLRIVDLTKEFNLKRSTVDDIVKERTWRNVRI